MPSLANLSMRGVGMVPPYTPKLPQPTLSTRMNTMLGFFAWALALGAPAVLNNTTAVANVKLIFLAHLMVFPPIEFTRRILHGRWRLRGIDARAPIFRGIVHLHVHHVIVKIMDKRLFRV